MKTKFKYLYLYIFLNTKTKNFDKTIFSFKQVKLIDFKANYNQLD
jgi:hypothetical protein